MPWQVLIRRRQLVVVQRIGDLGRLLWAGQAEQRILFQLAFGGQPLGVLAQRLLAGDRGGRLGTARRAGR